MTCESKKRLEEKILRIYTTDCLKTIAETLGGTISSRFYDLVYVEETDERTGDEIARDVISRAGLKVKVKEDDII